MPLEYLCLNISEVSDLTPLKGMKLKTLLVEHSHVHDLGPAWDMPLEYLALAGSARGGFGPRESAAPEAYMAGL